MQSFEETGIVRFQDELFLRVSQNLPLYWIFISERYRPFSLIGKNKLSKVFWKLVGLAAYRCRYWTYIVLKFRLSRHVELTLRVQFAKGPVDILFHSVEIYRAIERISGIRDGSIETGGARNPKRTAFERSLHPSLYDDKTTIATQNLSGEASLRYGSVYPVNPVIIRSSNTPHGIPQQRKIYLTERIGHGMKKRER